GGGAAGGRLLRLAAVHPSAAAGLGGRGARRGGRAAVSRAARLDRGRRASESFAMSVRAFEPKFMKVSVLTAALQELTPRSVRDADPDRAIEDWLAFARDLDCPHIQLSAALHPSQADVPPEAMLDPVANTL